MEIVEEDTREQLLSCPLNPRVVTCNLDDFQAGRVKHLKFRTIWSAQEKSMLLDSEVRVRAHQARATGAIRPRPERWATRAGSEFVRRKTRHGMGWTGYGLDQVWT